MYVHGHTVHEGQAGCGCVLPFAFTASWLSPSHPCPPPPPLSHVHNVPNLPLACRLPAAPPPLRRTPEEHRVTVAWLRECVARQELLVCKRETPLWRPLYWKLPLRGFSEVVLAVSQYHAEQRDVLRELVTRLGGCAGGRAGGGLGGRVSQPGVGWLGLRVEAGWTSLCRVVVRQAGWCAGR